MHSLHQNQVISHFSDRPKSNNVCCHSMQNYPLDCIWGILCSTKHSPLSFLCIVENRIHIIRGGWRRFGVVHHWIDTLQER